MEQNSGSQSASNGTLTSETLSPKAQQLLSTTIRLRSATSADVNFIFSSWLKAYRRSEFAKEQQNPIYFENQHKLIESLLKRCDVMMACDHNDTAQIYGYSVTEKLEGAFVVHFAYTKETYRKLGVQQLLMTTQGYTLNTPCIYTHRTFKAAKYERDFPVVYNPYVAFYGYYDFKKNSLMGTPK